MRIRSYDETSSALAASSVAFRCVEGVDACLLSQSDVVGKHGLVNFHVERARPRLAAKHRTELFLIVRLGHENMSATQPAAHRAREFHGPWVGSLLMRMRSTLLNS